MKDSDKLKKVISQLNLTANAIAKPLGYKSHASIYHVLDGRVEMSSNMKERLVKAYPSINKNFLENGELPVILDEEEMIYQANKYNIPLQMNSEIYKIQKILEIPDVLKRIEAKLDRLLEAHN